MTVDILPDVALLEIFNFYMDELHNLEEDHIEPWHTLVHVCGKWRNVVFGSPRRLGLRIYYKARTPVRKMLDLWPPLPIAVTVFSPKERDVDNIIAVLEHNVRICEIDITNGPSLKRSQFERLLAAMQRPFPALTRLVLAFEYETAPAIPALFLGGCAPRLQTFRLGRIPFPGLPTLLLSATHLVHLDLWKIPHSGYISPEAIVTCLSTLIRLESLVIKFESPRSRLDRKNQKPPPQTRTLVPVLTELWFQGTSDYFEDLVARVHAPLLDKLRALFFHQLIFDTPELAQFISRTPKFRTHDEARVFFSLRVIYVTLPQTLDGKLELGILCRQPDWQVSSLAQVCTSLPRALFSMVERLYFQSSDLSLYWQDDIDNSQWLEFLRPFTAVKGFYLPKIFVPLVVPALQELVRATEVLPALQTLFLDKPHPSDPVQEAIGQFVSARQLSGHPIAISRRVNKWND